jgi:choline dehydrogenase-like flavoprotein
VNRKFANLTGLRVVDCPIMPTLVGGDTNAPAIMIGDNSVRTHSPRSSAAASRTARMILS